MAGTPAGGQKAAQTNLKKHGKDFYKRIGKKGGQNGHTGGFASNPELAKIAGRKGGKKGHRGSSKHPKGGRMNEPSLIEITDNKEFMERVLKKSEEMQEEILNKAEEEEE